MCPQTGHFPGGLAAPFVVIEAGPPSRWGHRAGECGGGTVTESASQEERGWCRVLLPGAWASVDQVNGRLQDPQIVEFHTGLGVLPGSVHRCRDTGRGVFPVATMGAAEGARMGCALIHWYPGHAGNSVRGMCF